MPDDWADLRRRARPPALVKVGIETDRGPWVAALVAAGYEVFAINPMSVARYRERHSTSGAKSDAADAHLLAEIVRLDRAHHRPVAGDTRLGEAIKLAARTHQTLIWDRTRQVLRLRSRAAGVLPRRAAGLRRPRRTRRARAAGPGTGPRPGRPADHRRRSPRRCRRAHRRDVEAKAAPAAGSPAGAGSCASHRRADRLRRDRGQRGRAHHRAQHPDRGARGGGGRPFWPAPGR